MSNIERLQAILSDDPLKWRILDLVRSLRLPDCWIGAGFVRNAVWDHLHGYSPSRLTGDVDVLWFDPQRGGRFEDERLETMLATIDSSIDWSVKNQARMHLHNGDAPYASVPDAMRFWPETATAVAVRRTEEGDFEIAAPFGLDDLFDLVLRPTPGFVGRKHNIFLNRVSEKGWLSKWPHIRLEGAG